MLNSFTRNFVENIVVQELMYFSHQLARGDCSPGFEQKVIKPSNSQKHQLCVSAAWDSPKCTTAVDGKLSFQCSIWKLNVCHLCFTYCEKSCMRFEKRQTPGKSRTHYRSDNKATKFAQHYVTVLPENTIFEIILDTSVLRKNMASVVCTLHPWPPSYMMQLERYVAWAA